MEIEKKRMLFLGITIAAAIIGSLIFFLWGTALNRGTLNVDADAPFRVEKITGEIVQCPGSPCELKLKSGLNDLIFHKDGYKSILISADVKLWRNTALNVPFQIIPKVQVTDRFPEKEIQTKYSLEDLNGRQALVKNNEAIPIVYFPKPLNSPLIFGNEKHVLLIEEKKQKNATLYKVDVHAKKRTAVDIRDFDGALQGTLSPDGNFLVFWKDPANAPAILNTNNGEIMTLNAQPNLELSSWVYDESLIFATRQGFKSQNIYGNYEGNYIELLDEETDRLTFVAYHPDENSYTVLADFPLNEILLDGLPEELIAASNGQVIYFQSEDLKYKVVLRQF